MNTIYIIAGPVKSGKSTKIFEWVRNQPGVSGILSLLIDGKKHIFSISDETKECLETVNEDGVIVGRYMFDQKVFEWAQRKLTNELNNATRFLIIDEIGYLELKGEGLEPMLSTIIKAVDKRDDITLILVVRESLLNQVIEHYNIYNYKIINDIKSLT